LSEKSREALVVRCLLSFTLLGWTSALLELA
jgi:hypothetical protein